eukprot:TRINITY_DN3098_c0_g1_i6.p1 TRINITY_DN3098_c0_g1~~TRINITY_DN3098_c0_g1_i6.p1  ORF type:complete len:380 (+),score=68.67 TRINITY_DN3098_c0_g1_i6:615-1754(+)
MCTVPHDDDPGTATAVVILSGNATDPEGDPLVIEWVCMLGEVETASSNIEQPTVVLGVGTHTCVLSSVDSYGARSNHSHVVTVNPEPNTPPIAKAGQDGNYTVPHDGSADTNLCSVALNGSSSGDDDGDSLNLAWDCGNRVTAQGELAFVMLPPGIHLCLLTATDSYGANSSDSTNVTVNPEPNAVPVANAGTDASYTVPHDGTNTTYDHQVYLNGSLSADSDNDLLTHHWDCGDNVVATQVESVIRLPAGSHSCLLTVTDSYGAASTSTVTIEMLAEPNSAPIARAGANLTLAAINTSNPAWQHYLSWSATENVILDGRASSDADGDQLEFQWDCGDSLRATGAIRALSLDLGVYVCTLTVTDSYGAFSTDSMGVTVS